MRTRTASRRDPRRPLSALLLGALLLSCGAVSAFADCGDAVVDVGEDCDDGNLTPGDCCSDVCAAEAVGASCTDGDPGTPIDRCDGQGACLPAPESFATLTRFSDPDPVTADRFGAAMVKVGNDRIAISDPSATVGAFAEAGAVYLFEVGSGALVRTFTPTDPSIVTGFGSALATDGVRLVVGIATSSGVDNKPRVVSFDIETGVQLVEFDSKPTFTLDNRWLALSSSGVLAAGEQSIFVLGVGGWRTQLVVRLFDVTSGALLRDLAPPSLVPLPAPGAERSLRLEFVGDELLVGAPGAPARAFEPANPLPQDGIIYRYDSLSGDLLQTLTHPDKRFECSRFGQSIAADENHLLTSRYCDTANGEVPGQPVSTAFLVDHASGAIVREFKSGYSWGVRAFGETVALDEDSVVVSAPIQSYGIAPDGSYTFERDFKGGIYVFDRDGGETLRFFPNPNPTDFNAIGRVLLPLGGEGAVVNRVALVARAAAMAPPAAAGDRTFLGVGAPKLDGEPTAVSAALRLSSALFRCPSTGCTRNAQEQKCHKTIRKEAAKLTQKRVAAVSTCIRGVNSGKVAGPCPDAKATQTIARAVAAVNVGKIADDCPGGEIAALELAGDCAGSTTANDVAACILSESETVASAMLDAEFVRPTQQLTDPALDCQEATAKASAKYGFARLSILSSCFGLRERGKVVSCPDAKVQTKLDKSLAVLTKNVAKACSDTTVAALTGGNAPGGCGEQLTTSGLVGCQRAVHDAAADALLLHVR